MAATVVNMILRRTEEEEECRYEQEKSPVHERGISPRESSELSHLTIDDNAGGKFPGHKEDPETFTSCNPKMETGRTVTSLKPVLAANKFIKDLKKLKAKREKHTREHFIDLVCYIIFMIVFTMNTTDGLGDHSYYGWTENVKKTLKLASFELISGTDSLNSWLQNDLISGIFSSNFEGPQDLPDYEENLAIVSGSMIQGPVRIAQLRSKQVNCRDDVPEMLRPSGFSFRCSRNRELNYWQSSFDLKYEADDDFNGFTYNNSKVDSITYQRDKTFGFTKYETKNRHKYPAPAYAILLDPHRNRSEAQALVDGMIERRYVDRQTDVLFIDISVYNYVLHMHGWVRLTAEFNSAGLDTTTDMQQIQLIWAPDRRQYRLALFTLVAFGYFYLLIMQLVKLRRMGLRVWITSLPTFIQIANIIFYVVQITYQSLSSDLIEDIARRHESRYGDFDLFGDRFIDMRPCFYAKSISLGMQAINTFLNWFKLIIFLYAYPSFGLMTDTFQQAAPELCSFFLVLFIIMFGFAQAHAIYFGKNVKSYRTLADSVHTLWRAMLGDFDFEETYDINRYMGPLFFYVFVLIGFLIVLNIVIAITSDAYISADKVRKERVKAIQEEKQAKIEAYKAEHGGNPPPKLSLKSTKEAALKIFPCMKGKAIPGSRVLPVSSES